LNAGGEGTAVTTELSGEHSAELSEDCPPVRSLRDRSQHVTVVRSAQRWTLDPM